MGCRLCPLHHSTGLVADYLISGQISPLSSRLYDLLIDGGYPTGSPNSGLFLQTCSSLPWSPDSYSIHHQASSYCLLDLSEAVLLPCHLSPAPCPRTPLTAVRALQSLLSTIHQPDSAYIFSEVSLKFQLINSITLSDHTASRKKPQTLSFAVHSSFPASLTSAMTAGSFL